MKKLYLIIFGIVLIAGLSAGIFTTINKTINFDSTTNSQLSLMGITSPIISSCIKDGDYSCTTNIYQKGGINKDIQITTKYCGIYVFEEVNDTCILYEQIPYQGVCLTYENITETICNNDTGTEICEDVITGQDCTSYETLYSDGACLKYSMKLVQTNVCDEWKTLTQTEIENAMINSTQTILNGIAQVQADRIKVKEQLTNDIQVSIGGIK